MEKNHSQFKQQKLLKKSKKPYIRYNKEKDEWIMQAKLIDEEDNNININEIQLDSIAKLVAYLYHDLKEKYQDSSPKRKEHIYNDLKKIDQWLTIQYNKLREKYEEKS
jgi:hypothetical protein